MATAHGCETTAADGGGARKVQKSDERWPALTNAQNLSYRLKVNKFAGLTTTGYKVCMWMLWTGLRRERRRQ